MEYNTKINNEDITIHYDIVSADDGEWIEIDKIIWHKEIARYKEKEIDITPLYDDHETWIDEINNKDRL